MLMIFRKKDQVSIRFPRVLNSKISKSLGIRLYNQSTKLYNYAEHLKILSI